ncbi:MAG: hypothetical protein ACLTER_19820 [Ruminococcus sp.]
MCIFWTETYEKFDREMFEKRCSLFSIPMDKKLKEFSTGMKAKLKVLTATSFDARLLVLDEPTAGLDVIARDSILELLLGIYGDGRKKYSDQLPHFLRSGEPV